MERLIRVLTSSFVGLITKLLLTNLLIAILCFPAIVTLILPNLSEMFYIGIALTLGIILINLDVIFSHKRKPEGIITKKQGEQFLELTKKEATR